MAPVMTCSWEWPMIADLTMGESPYKQVALSHIGERALSIQRTAHEPIQNSLLQIRCVFIPQVEHRLTVTLLLAIPVGGIAVEAIGQLLPHEGGVFSRRRLRRVKVGGTASPHHGRRDGP